MLLYPLVLIALAFIPLAMIATAIFAVVYGILYLIRCVNIARRHGA